MTPRTAPHVEDAGGSAESEGLDEEVDLLDRALRERVAEVGGAEVVCDRFEPVVRLGPAQPTGRPGS